MAWTTDFILCQCKLINCNKCTTPKGNVYNGRDYTCVGKRVHGKSLSFYPQFCCELKLLFGFPRWLSGKESACQYKRHGFDPWVRKIRCRRKRHSNILPGKSHGQGNMAGYSPWGCKRVRDDLATKQHKIALTKIQSLKRKTHYSRRTSCEVSQYKLIT